MTTLATGQRPAAPELSRGGAKIVGRSYSLTLPGLLYHLTTLFLAIGAINGQNNLLFWAFGLALGAILAGGVVSGSALMAIRAERIGFETATAGEPCTLRYAVSSTARWMPAMALTLTEPPGRLTSRKRSANRELRGIQGRLPAEVAHVGPGQRVVTQGGIVPAKRGPLELDRFVVSSSFPFGTLGKLVRISQPATLLVRPRRLALREGLLDGLLRSAGRGSESARGIGQGEELFGVREYRPGDPIREIAWGPSARNEQLVVRQRSSERGSKLRLQLELRPGGDPGEAEQAIAIAGQILRDAAQRGLAVGVTSATAGVMVPAGTGANAVDRALDALAMIDLASLEQADAPEAAAGETVVWIASGVDLPPGAIGLQGASLASAASDAGSDGAS